MTGHVLNRPISAEVLFPVENMSMGISSQHPPPFFDIGGLAASFSVLRTSKS